MSPTVLRIAAALLLIATASAEARDSRHLLPIEEALNSTLAGNKLSKDIKFYFGKQTHPPIAKSIGHWTSNKKTNAANKSDEEACRIAFVSSLIALQERAQREGGNAIVNIHSVYKGENVASNKEYLCGAGAIMAGVALEGTVVKLAK
ncbi:MAG: hypothetical protein HY308_05115 [Gammaproteobacteria bacterium]|nr:hypothetical protein [Gammaproteobacteria bacterium]